MPHSGVTPAMIRHEAQVEQLPPSEGERAAGASSKSILLFSDGTGNSSAKLFKTNVWRLYEAVDLGPAPPGERVQIAYYDNGVGTSAFRPLALLGGIFGWGLKRNVLRLYTYLCRNYRDGDRIYAFGFSRGAFTIRLLVALIAKQGILYMPDDADLPYHVHDAYRAYCGENIPRRWHPAVAKGVRAIRDGLIWLKRAIRGPSVPYKRAERRYADIDFVGVWDTVAAYGGPFAELTRGIDDWVWPLSMPNYRLSPRVRRARHALALDDERDAFWPLLWDEHFELEQVRNGGEYFDIGDDGTVTTHVRPVSRHRLRQVWFAGVHSDVGGGYPDESLSYVSLCWMMDELGDELRFIPQFASRARSLANPLGPIHDSRAGFAAYYRYQPRKIVAFLDPPKPETASLREPHSSEEAGSRGLRERIRSIFARDETKRHGLLKRVLVHESALARIVSGTDNYAPAALPATFIPMLAAGGYGRSSLSTPNLRSLTRSVAERRNRFERQENQWDRVWRRRLLYFLTVFATLLLLLLPYVPWLGSLEDLCADDRCFARDISETLLFFLPNSFRDLLVPWTARPIGTLVLLVAILSMIWAGRRIERSFRDGVRRIWSDFRNGNLAGASPPARTTLRRFRESKTYQFALFDLKWRFLPFLAGLAALFAIAYSAIIVVTQALYAFAEPHQLFCKDRGQPAQRLGSPVRIRIDEPCSDLLTDVLRAHSYRLVLTPNDRWNRHPWNDGWSKIAGIEVYEIPAGPPGGVSHETLAMILGRPLKRVTHARWLQPVTEVRADQTEGLRKWQWLVGKDIELREVHFRPGPAGTYVSGELCPRRTGQLSLMVNDAAPLLWGGLYRNNGGSAVVTVEANGCSCVPIGEREEPRRETTAGGYCRAR